jgi:hypothetical protein
MVARRSGVACASARCADCQWRSSPANCVERHVVDDEEAGLLEVGLRDAPAAAEVAVEVVAEHLAQRPLGLLALQVLDGGVARVLLERQLQGLEHCAARARRGAGRSRSGGRDGAPQAGAEERDLDEVVEVAGLERGVLAVVGEAEQLARIACDVAGLGAAGARWTWPGRWSRCCGLRSPAWPACRSRRSGARRMRHGNAGSSRNGAGNQAAWTSPPPSMPSGRQVDRARQGRRRANACAVGDALGRSPRASSRARGSSASGSSAGHGSSVLRYRNPPSSPSSLILRIDASRRRRARGRRRDRPRRACGGRRSTPARTRGRTRSARAACGGRCRVRTLALAA